jgi:hypothetical protein
MLGTLAPTVRIGSVQFFRHDLSTSRSEASSSGELVVGLIESVVAVHGMKDVAAPAGESDEGLAVAFALGDFAAAITERERVAECCEARRGTGLASGYCSSVGTDAHRGWS